MNTPDPLQQLNIRLVPADNIETIALLHHAQLRARRPDMTCEETNCDSQTRDRWAVNYIRHKLTNYDELCSHHRTDATILARLKNRVLDLIAETYPRLAAACALQKSTIA